jgi:hypothetical protein
MPSVPIPPPPELLVCNLAGTTIRDRGEVPSAFQTALVVETLSALPALWLGAAGRGGQAVV